MSAGAAGSAWFDHTGQKIYCVMRSSGQLYNRVISVTFEAEPDVRLGRPEEVFSTEGDEVVIFDFDPVRKRFVGTRRLEAERHEIVVDTAWTEGL